MPAPKKYDQETQDRAVRMYADRMAEGETVSLWYLLCGPRHERPCRDEREFAAARWWNRNEVTAADPRSLERHLPRFLAKLNYR